MKQLLSFLAFCCLAGVLTGQDLRLETSRGLAVTGFSYNNTASATGLPVPLFSVSVDDSLISSGDVVTVEKDGTFFLDFGGGLLGELSTEAPEKGCWKGILTFINISGDTLILENMVPFGDDPGHVYITGTGPWSLARAALFRPNKAAVPVILPDNAWEMGYGAVPVDDHTSLSAIARRKELRGGKKQRYKTQLYPGGSMDYAMWACPYEGNWQNGLRKMFREKYLFEFDAFDHTLYERPDLEWIRHKYLLVMQFAWDRSFYDWHTKEYTVETFLQEGKNIFGGYDIYGLWPTWPRLGVDDRNQWDMFSSLPGGLDRIREISTNMQEEGTAFFICYNPWDESTRKESPCRGMARLIEATDANGVVLDCHGWSGEHYQKAADSIKEGVVMFSEGMAVIRDMPGIVSGRVHNAIYMSPLLNLNKLIKPDFAIFRVLERKDPHLDREIGIALFNGYGTEINHFAPGRPESTMEDFHYLARTTRILRENTSCFQSPDWTPLIPVLHDSIWVNRWPLGSKEILTVYSLIPEGFDGPLFEAGKDKDHHYVSLWHHKELSLSEKNGTYRVPATCAAFNREWLGTRQEGRIDCIARFPSLINGEIRGNTMHLSCDAGDELRIWPGTPSCRKEYAMRNSGDHTINLPETFGNYRGDFVVQLFDNKELADEIILTLSHGTPVLIPGPDFTGHSIPAPREMVTIRGGEYDLISTNDDQFIPYPRGNDTVRVTIRPFLMDKYPVSNGDYHAFIRASGYVPADTSHYLRHWENGACPDSLRDHPVVWISPEDAVAYAKWHGKRLPTEAEWQYAAQGNTGWEWPWGPVFDSTHCNNASGRTTPKDAFPGGKSRYGVYDLVGNVWQLTSDRYANDSYTFVIMKGGSFYEPVSSGWYVQGGPQPVTRQQMLLLANPGLNRNATVGFRCVKDLSP